MSREDEGPARGSPSRPPPENLEALERIAAEIESYLSDALALLPEQDRALLVDHYELEGLGGARPPKPAELRTEEARRVALRRARRRFSRMLESLLAGALEHEPTRQETLEEALRIVRGESSQAPGPETEKASTASSFLERAR